MTRTLPLIASLLPLCLAAEGPKINVFELPDTVSSPTLTLLAATEPSATATIQGEAVKVYRTGSFGRELTLKPGDNAITLTATTPQGTTTKMVNIFVGARHTTPKQHKPQPTAFAQPITVETLTGAYLQYGNGDDRLGGSKMGFLPAGLLLTAVGQEGGLYKIRLSADRWAYLPVEYAQVSDKKAPQVPVNTGSWSVVSNDRYDVVSVNLPAALPYSSTTQLDPSEIIIDLYGAFDNSNWITQRPPLGMIDYVYFEPAASDVYRIHLRLKERYQWGYTIDYEGNRLVVKVRHRPSSLRLKDLVIGVDAGHGGEGSLGAVSPSGICEKDVNLKIARYLRDELQAHGARVVMTRDDDVYVTMAERKRLWREGQVDLAVAIHNNASRPRLKGLGTSTYYKHLFDRPLAAALLNRMEQLGLPQFGLTGNFNFSLNGPTDYPNALVECAFLDALDQEELLSQDAYLRRIAHQIFLGLQDYLKAVES